MKVRYLCAFSVAIALMASAPMAMACAPCHVGASDHQASVFDVGKASIAGPADKLTLINADSKEPVSTSGVKVPITAYVAFDTSYIRTVYRKPVNSDLVRVAGLTSNVQANPQAIVLTA